MKKIFLLCVTTCVMVGLSAMQRRGYGSKTQQKIERQRICELDELRERQEALRARGLQLIDEESWDRACFNVPLVLCACCGLYTCSTMSASEITAWANPESVLQISECFCGLYLIPRIWCGDRTRERRRTLEQTVAEMERIKQAMVFRQTHRK